jgi:hypothetical protein
MLVIIRVAGDVEFAGRHLSRYRVSGTWRVNAFKSQMRVSGSKSLLGLVAYFNGH